MYQKFQSFNHFSRSKWHDFVDAGVCHEVSRHLSSAFWKKNPWNDRFRGQFSKNNYNRKLIYEIKVNNTCLGKVHKEVFGSFFREK